MGIEDNINYTQLMHDSMRVFIDEKKKNEWPNFQYEEKRKALSRGYGYTDNPKVREFIL